MISSHVRPDADALGSELGMAAILESFGKDVTIVNATAPPANLQFLNPEGKVLKLGETIARADLPAVDVHIIVDTSAWQQLGTMTDVIVSSGKRRVVIDHHVSSDSMGAMEFKDVNSAATGELIFEAAEALGVCFDAVTSTALYAAIATDTGWFRFPNTSPNTMRIISALMASGATPHLLYNHLYEQKSLARIRLGGRVLSRVESEADGALTWIYVNAEDLKLTSAVPADSESLVNECLTIAGSQAAFIAVELPNSQIKVSLRCRPPFDVECIARQFGGGGHKLASGATVDGPLKPALDLFRKAFKDMLLSEEIQPPAVTADP